MAKIDTKISYEKEEDILSLWRGRPSKVSVEIGDFIVDIDNNGFISGLEILNATENLNMGLDTLSKIENIAMAVTYKPNYVSLVLSIKFRGKENVVTIPLTLDLGHKRIEKENIMFSKN